MTTSFMPTRVLGQPFARDASDVIQFGEFSKLEGIDGTLERGGAVGGALVGGALGAAYGGPWGAVLGGVGGAVAGHFGGKTVKTNTVDVRQVYNYGVAPDFACGHQVYLPAWIDASISQDAERRPVTPRETAGFTFVEVPRFSDDVARAMADPYVGPGFLLAIYQETLGGLALLEAFDTWLHHDREMTMEEFREGVLARNNGQLGFSLQSNTTAHYVTTNGTALEFVIWNNGERHGCRSGAEVLSVSYGQDTADWPDAVGGADKMPTQLLNGTIMNSRGVDEAVVEIGNPQLGTTITLDFNDAAHPSRRDSGTGEFEVAGFGHEVWLDFEYTGPAEGDVCQPFNSIATAEQAVGDQGIIRVLPSASGHRGLIGAVKRFTLVAPIGGVTIGAMAPPPAPEDATQGQVSDRDVWVQSGWTGTGIRSFHVPNVYGSVSEAIRAVAGGGVIHLEPGDQRITGTIGNGKHFTLVAPIGGVKIGAIES